MYMSTSKNTLCVFAACAILAACNSETFVTHNGNMPSNDRILMIQKGQDRARVREILGAPSSINPLDGNTWIYMSSDVRKVAFFKPEELDRDVLTIKFDDDGIVSSISRYSKANGKEIIISEDATDFDKGNKSFFEEYFGGVGAYIPIAPNNNQK